MNHKSLIVVYLTSLTLLGYACCAPRTPQAPVSIELVELADDFDDRAFGAVVAALEEQAAVGAPVVISVCTIDAPVWGWTLLVGPPPFEHYVIEIEARQPFYSLLDTLVHEWAHAMVWKASPCTSAYEDEHHGPLWGVAYAHAYNIALDAGQQYYTQRALDSLSQTIEELSE